MSAQGMLLKQLIEQTMQALEQMDADALEKLVATAESMREEAVAQPHATRWETAQEAGAASDVLQQLLAATDRNLALLRRLRGAAEERTALGDSGTHGLGRNGLSGNLSGQLGGQEVIGYGERFDRSLGRGGAWQR